MTRGAPRRHPIEEPQGQSHADLQREPRAGDDPSMLEIAQGISMFIADDAGTLAEFNETLDAFDVLVNEKMPAALRAAKPEKN